MNQVIAVVGAGGGVGASTLAALLARSARRPVLVDLDRCSGGIDVLLGLESATGVRWPDLLALDGGLDPGDVAVLPSWRGVEVLSAGRSAGLPDRATRSAVVEVLRRRGEVVLDLPAAEVLADGMPLCDQAVLVAGQDVLGVAAALAVRDALDVPASLLLRHRRTRQVAPLEAAHLLDLPLLGLLPTDRRLAGAVDRGIGPVPGRRLRRAVARVAAGVGLARGRQR